MGVSQCRTLVITKSEGHYNEFLLYRGYFPHILLLLRRRIIVRYIPRTSLYRGSLYQGFTVIQCGRGLDYFLSVWKRVTVTPNPEFSSRIPESLMIGIRNPVSENWNRESKTVLDYLTCRDWLEIRRFDTSRFDTNSSSEIAQKFHHFKLSLQLNKKSILGGYSSSRSAWSDAQDINWKTGGKQRQAHGYCTRSIFSSVGDFCCSWIYKD